VATDTSESAEVSRSSSLRARQRNGGAGPARGELGNAKSRGTAVRCARQAVRDRSQLASSLRKQTREIKRCVCHTQRVRSRGPAGPAV
jgi:hypothetical protein